MKAFFIVGVVMLLVRCKADRELITSTNTARTDSVRIVERVRVDTLRIPAERATLTIGSNALMRDTVLTARQNHAQARIVVRDGLVNFTAVCDSLERLVLSYERLVYELKNSVREAQNYETKTRSPPWLKLLPLVLIAIIGAAILIKLTIK